MGSKQLIENWRDTADDNNPAGGLFASGEYAEADIVGRSAAAESLICGTACTGHSTKVCC
ncbi:MAG TPA: DUF6229 family protein [Rhizomicrobium sp.]